MRRIEVSIPTELTVEQFAIFAAKLPGEGRIDMTVKTDGRSDRIIPAMWVADVNGENARLVGRFWEVD